MFHVRKLATAAVIVVMIAVIAVAAGLIYNEASIASLRAQAGVRGRLYAVSGHRMHLFCSGSGEPTLVLSAGLGDDSLVFARLQAALSSLTRVCSYDRAGLGWSDARPDVPDSQNIAAELHELLQQAEISPPIVLAGHSISGVHIRAYAERYQNDLAGLVFLDGSTPLQDPLFPRVYAEIDRQRRNEIPRELAMMALGIDRLQGKCAPDLTGGVASYARWLAADTCILGAFMQAQRELDAVPASGNQVVHSGLFGSLPILIFSRDPNVRRTDMPAADARTGSLLWDRLQERLKALSTRSRRIIALRSDHYVFVDREALVIAELQRLIVQLRGHGAPSTPYGSTIAK